MSNVKDIVIHLLVSASLSAVATAGGDDD